MTIDLRLSNPLSKVAMAVAAVAVCALLAYMALGIFVTGMLIDPRKRPERDALATAVGYFPDSARLRARLAEAEAGSRERNLDQAHSHALGAINLSPHDFRFRVLLASIKEMQQDRDSAEEALRAAAALAPYNRDVSWRLANLLVRAGKLDASLDEFRKAVAANAALLPATLDLVWRSSGEDLKALEQVAGQEPEHLLVLAQFLLKQSRTKEAAQVLGRAGAAARMPSSEVAPLLNQMIAGGELEQAHDLWLNVTNADRQSESAALMHNGGFESDIRKDLSQFDWTISRSDYARISIAANESHAGARALKIEFIGRDTTVLDNEIRQLVLARPGARYRLQYYARSGELVTPEGPRVVVADAKSNAPLATSEPVAAGSHDWRQFTLDFVAPPPAGQSTVAPVYVSIKRQPRFAYDDPTRGTVWFDEFVMNAQDSGKNPTN